SIASTDKVCSVCGKGGKLVFGNVSVYKFYTIDKKGFISGGFVKSNAWKNYPVCEECKIYLEEGKKFIEKNLSFRFYGLNYHLVPDFILGVGDTPSRVLEIFEDASSLISLREGSIKRLTDDEEEILGLLAKEEDYVALNLLFLRKMKQAERIILLIEEVLPSRLRKIFIAKDFVDEIFGENFNFGKIRQFFPKKDNENPDLNKYFLEITDRIFRSNMIDCRFVLSAVIKKIRDMFVNGEKFRNQVIDGLMVFLFLEKLSLVCFEEVSMEESYFESIFSRYKPVFQMPAKRGIFLLGCLTELLLRKQYAERQTKPPFIKNLKGLRMDERDIKSLLPKVQNKLEEYDSFDKGKKMVSQEVSRYLLAAGDNWRLSCDEINFYFVCGMNLADEVNSLLYER
ncbi:MAG: TIGR02556 family CRISPR-associated protein, partial [Actinobacteria bacterium]|nr:TIGR02556 family CRISPR-associated protein [Actinomycetota bacterium]